MELFSLRSFLRILLYRIFFYIQILELCICTKNMHMYNNEHLSLVCVCTCVYTHMYIYMHIYIIYNVYVHDGRCVYVWTTQHNYIFYNFADFTNFFCISLFGTDVTSHFFSTLFASARSSSNSLDVISSFDFAKLLIGRF